MTRVLVVDDEKSIRLTLREFLTAAGYDVEIAEDAGVALDLLRKGGFDVVVSDIILPRMTGVELLQEIRSVSSRVQVILMTGEPTVETASDAVRAGAFDYLFKPVSKEAILRTVGNAAKLKAVDDERERLVEVNRQHQENLEQLVEERTEALRRSQEQFFHAQKMEAVGALAGGVAHDFNNLLTVITGYCDLMLGRLTDEERMASKLEVIRKAAMRAAELTRQLLTFSRKQTLQPKVLDLNALVANLENMLRRVIGENIEIQMALDPGLGHILADPGQIEQVIMNLAVNAKDALPNGGQLSIRTGNTYLDEQFVLQNVESEVGHYVVLSLTDTGCGMDQNTRERAFEPFFTTKPAGKGTGLGLATAYGIVKQSGGYIHLHSEPARGTTFNIYLPRVVDEVASTRWSAIPEQDLKGVETVLLVEDDDLVRNVAREILTASGYRVIPAVNGGEALQSCEARTGPIHLVLADLVMPGMSGPELVERLSALRPDTRVAYMSGYARGAGSGGEQLKPETPFLQKPFTREALLKTVRAALEGKPIQAAGSPEPDSSSS